MKAQIATIPIPAPSNPAITSPVFVVVVVVVGESWGANMESRCYKHGVCGVWDCLGG